MDYDELMRQVPIHTMNMMKTLSAILDANGGSMIIPKDVWDKADFRYFLTMNDENGRVVIQKHVGASPMFNKIMGKKPQ